MAAVRSMHREVECSWLGLSSSAQGVCSAVNMCGTFSLIPKANITISAAELAKVFYRPRLEIPPSVCVCVCGLNGVQKVQS